MDIEGSEKMSEGDQFVAEMNQRYLNVDEFREDFLSFWKHYKKVGVEGACDDATMRMLLNCGDCQGKTHVGCPFFLIKYFGKNGI